MRPRKYNYNVICDQYASGLSLNQVAKLHRTDASTIRKVIIRAGSVTRTRKDVVKRGSDSPFWLGGKSKDKCGYSIINDGYLKEHRVIFNSLFPARKLEAWESIHHVDGNKQNNDLNNLVAMPTREHTRFHSFLRLARMSLSQHNLVRFCKIEPNHRFRFTKQDDLIAKEMVDMPVCSNSSRRKCSVPRCDYHVSGHGLCSKHYQRFIARRRGYWLSSKGRRSKFTGNRIKKVEILFP